MWEIAAKELKNAVINLIHLVTHLQGFRERGRGVCGQGVRQVCSGQVYSGLRCLFHPPRVSGKTSSGEVTPGVQDRCVVQCCLASGHSHEDSETRGKCFSQWLEVERGGGKWSRWLGKRVESKSRAWMRLASGAERWRAYVCSPPRPSQY
ncbi:hypothetical protein E2C01_079443 [Portunus trituberculatus]|uniref:Uncharacterized protein n=1 Tax=Portunus trituberculatus TaxID=210409 RepID=A0A5B7ITD4_PORTR|nr:hypothetical protein [Portunus trituberculatus]